MEEETEYEQSQEVLNFSTARWTWDARIWDGVWDDFCASVTDGCDDDD